MKTNTRILKLVASVALVASSVSVASAAGLLGQRYAAATYDWVLWDENAIDDGHGITLTLNQPLSSNIDLSVDYSYLDTGVSTEAGSFDMSGQTLAFNGTYYMPAGNMKPFIKAGAGWAWTKIAGETDNDMIYQIVPGIEIPAGEKASLTLFAAWQDYFDNEAEDDGTWDFGAIAEFAVSSQWSVLVRGSVDDDSNYGFSAGALLRF